MRPKAKKFSWRKSTGRNARGIGAVGLGLAALIQIAGCPGAPSTPLEYVAGSTGTVEQIAATPAMTVLAPTSDLAITGGTPVEVVWRAQATSSFATVRIVFDVDTVPNNGNEIEAQADLPLTQTSALLDTTRLAAGDYFIGVILELAGDIQASAYARGRLTINQQPTFFFDSPRDNLIFDRTTQNNPRLDVSWTVSDPDSIVRVQILLDPDNRANGNEVLLRESTSQSGDSFSFNLQTANFAAGTYRLLAVVSDGVSVFTFYAPGTIQLRQRLAGLVDLRNMDLAQSDVRGAIFEGFNPRDNAGSFVSSARDVDGDGFGDFLILSQFGKPQYQFNTQRVGVGEAYMVYGRRDRFSGRINLNSTGTLFRGEIYGGVPEVADPIRPTRGITSFAVLSDWDGDGVREFAFGMPFTDSLSLSLLLTENADIVALDQSGYFRSGGVVIAAGSSLRPDLGFPGRNVFNLAEFGTLGHAPIVIPPPCPEGFYGPKSPTGTSVTYFHRHLISVGGTPNEGSIRLGARISTNDFDDQCGETIAAYDFNSLLISVPNRDPLVNIFSQNTSIPGAGVVSIFYNFSDTGHYLWTATQAPPANAAFNYPGTPENPDIDSLPHHGPYHYILDDLRLFNSFVGLQPGSPGYWVDGPAGGTDAEPCTVEISENTPIPSRTVRIWGGLPGARIGNAKSIADFNADGLQDIVIGSPLSNEGAGSCFIVLGRIRELVLSGELAIEELGLPMNSAQASHQRIFDGIRVVGNPNDRLGQSQDSAGDFNGDGVFDVVIGSPFINGRQGGAAVFFGSRDVINLTQEEIPFNELPARGLGVIFVGEEEGDLAGARVAGVGDIDGDGLSDIMIAAPNRSVHADIDLDGTIDVDRTNCGVVYLIYGSPNLRGTINLSKVGTPDLPGAVFIGRNSGDFLGAGIGEQGDRSMGIAGIGDIDGDGRNDLMLSAITAAPRNRARAGESYLIYGR